MTEITSYFLQVTHFKAKNLIIKNLQAYKLHKLQVTNVQVTKVTSNRTI